MDAARSSEPPGSSERSALRLLCAWAVHLLTASGAVIGTVALLRISRGDFHSAALLLLLALFIDGIDGSLARAVGVAQLLPKINGRRLDDIVDFLNFTIVPAAFMANADLLLSWEWIAFPVLASAYGFSREDAKTEDDFFLGFPSYWNILAIYLWMLGISPLTGTLWVVCLSLAVFIPIKCIYPTKTRILRKTTLAGGALWFALFSLAVSQPELAERLYLFEISLLYMVYYWVLSFWLGGLQRRDESTP
jgi:phosphatidylcholine synthase